MPVEIKNPRGNVIFTYPADTLVGANLENAKLSEAVFARMDLSGAILDGADLEFAHCRGANFSGASLKNAYMVYGQFQEAVFTGTDFEGANIERAKFYDANLLGARNWHKLERDFQAKFLGATMPDGRKVERE